MKEEDSRRIPKEWWDDLYRKRRMDRIHTAICILLPNLVLLLYVLLLKLGWISAS